MRLGLHVPARKKDAAAAQKREYPPAPAIFSSLRGAGRSLFHHAGKRERDFRLLQHFPAQIRRRHRGRRNDHPDERHAVCDAPAAGLSTGRAAGSELQLRRKKCRPREAGVPAASYLVSGLLDRSLGLYPALPAGLCLDLHT